MTRRYKRRSYHGMTETKTYRVWWDMHQRCRNPRLKQFHNYGGRGIKVCARWENFEYFYTDMGEKPTGKGIDRIDNDGNYEPGNCRWATAEQQCNNQRFNVLIKFKGQSMTIPAWSRKTGLRKNCIWYRLRVAGWPVSAALTTPTRRNHAL